MRNEALVKTHCLICRRVGISAADRTRLASGQPGSTATTALPAGHVLELHYGCVRISATSSGLHRSVVAGVRPGSRRCRPRCRYPNSRPPGYRGSRASRWDRARGTEYRAPWTSTPTSRWGWWSAWRWATLTCGRCTSERLSRGLPLCGCWSSLSCDRCLSSRTWCQCDHRLSGRHPASLPDGSTFVSYRSSAHQRRKTLGRSSIDLRHFTS